MYTTQYYQHDSHEPCLNLIAEFWFTRKRDAQRFGKALMKGQVVQTTRYYYHRDVNRADSVRVVSDARITSPGDGRDYPVFSEWLGPEVCIVPSVGELGYTP